MYSPQTARRLKSDTNDAWLDQVTIEDASDTDSDEQFDQALASTPIPWSPREIQCDRPQNLDQALREIHENMPQLQRIEPGQVHNMTHILDSLHENSPDLQVIIPNRVYNMEPILRAVDRVSQRRESVPTADVPDESQTQQSESNSRQYSLREKERLDYKKIHEGRH